MAFALQQSSLDLLKMRGQSFVNASGADRLGQRVLGRSGGKPGSR